jgi:hypothetical protein
MDATATAWNVVYTDSERFGMRELNALWDGTAACVVIDNFYPEASCRAIADNVARLGFKRSYTGDNVDARFSGIAAMEFIGRKDEYFATAPAAEADRRELVGSQPDPINGILHLLANAWPAGARIADDSGRPYFAGIVRFVKNVAHHTDSAARDLPGWSVGQIQSQLACNLYLTEAEAGGELAIWHRHWRPEDEKEYRYDRATKKGYRPEIVQGYPFAVVPPRVGRLILLNALYYHKVLDVIGAAPRLTIASFIGTTDEHSPLILWG